MEKRFTQRFLRNLSENFPSQEACHVCHVDFLSPDAEEDDPMDETEICLRCYQTYHIECLDNDGPGACTVCLGSMMDSGNVRGDQPEGGKVMIQIVEDGQPIPGYEDVPGHIEIIYSIPSGVRVVSNTYCLLFTRDMILCLHFLL